MHRPLYKLAQLPGLDRKLLRKGSFTHADLVMGTSQQLSSKSEMVDMKAGREVVSTRSVSVRQSLKFGSGGPPVVAAHYHAMRAVTRPPPSPSAPFGNLLSPRNCQSTSYRDAAMVAVHHGLSAYAPSASTSSAAARGPTPRSGGGSPGVPGRPPPVPRPMQHSAPSPVMPTSNGAVPTADFLPSCSGASPSRNNTALSRFSVFLPSRGSAVSPGSPSRGDVYAAAEAASSTSSHRPGDVALLTVTHNDVWWRGAFDGSADPDGPLVSMGGGGGALRPLSGAAGAIPVMSPCWGSASPSTCEADGRPGTRGGGPQFDIDGRPTTRGGQRPPSRAQLSLAPHRPPLHVAPLVGPLGGRAGLFASRGSGGCGMGLGETVPAVALPPALYISAPRAPSAGASLSWSGDAIEQPGSLRRQLLPLSPTEPGTSTTAVAAAVASPSSPQACVFGSGNDSEPASGSSLIPFSAPLGSSLRALSASHSSHISEQTAEPLTAATAVGCSAISDFNGGFSGGARTYLASMLSSIGETPSSSVLLSLPQQNQQPQQFMGRPEGGNGNGRKAPREREASFASHAGDLDSPQPYLPSASNEEVRACDSGSRRVE